MFEPLPAVVLPLRQLAAGEATSADPHGLSSACPVRAGVPASACAGFELQTSDGIWHAASVSSVTRNGTGIILTIASALQVPNSSAEVTVSRFGFAPWPVNSVVTAGDVPLFPWGAHKVTRE